MGIKSKGIIKIRSERTSGDFIVKFIDYDGTVLKSQYVNSGETANVPTLPSHDYLKFNSWNYPYTNITQDTYISTTYDTADGKSYLFITLSNVSGVSPIIYLNKSNTALMTVEWGDTTSSTTTSSGNINLTHTYLGIGDYIIKISCSGYYNFGNGGSTIAIFSNTSYKDCLTKLYVGLNVSYIQSYGFSDNRGLECVSLPIGITSISSYAFFDCWSLIHINFPVGITAIGDYGIYEPIRLNFIILPNGITTIGFKSFYFCNSIKYINLPISITNIGEYSFYYSYDITQLILPPLITVINQYAFYSPFLLKKIIIPNGVTLIGSNAFYGCYSVEYISLPITITSIGALSFCYPTLLKTIIIYATTPPTLVNINAFTDINKLSKIYVPSGSVSSYKGATNWSTYANYIYPMV